MSFVRRAANFARQLPAVGVARDHQIGEAERLLRGSAHLAGQQNGAGAGAEKGHAARVKRAQRRFEALFLQKFEHGGAFAAGQNHSIYLRRVLRRAHENVIGAEALKHARVGFVIALHCEDADLHGRDMAVRRRDSSLRSE